jgi:hypothetical protein
MMIREISKAYGRKLAMLMIGACLAVSTTPSQAMPLRVAPMDEGMRTQVESVRYKPRPRRAVRRGGGNGAGAALMLGAVALGVGAIVASQQRNREERRARRYYEQQYYPAQQYYDPGYVREPVHQYYPAYQEQYAPPPPVYRAPRRVYHPAPVQHSYAPPRAHHVRALRPYSGQTARRERHEARQRFWNR